VSTRAANTQPEVRAPHALAHHVGAKHLPEFCINVPTGHPVLDEISPEYVNVKRIAIKVLSDV
jgi:hypothetical protein